MNDLPQRVESLIREGKKIEAIKLLREMHGLSLKEAKEIVDGKAQLRTGRDADLWISTEVEDLARQGKRIEAIRLLREQAGIGLKDARIEVDRISGRKGWGCTALLLLLTLPLAAISWTVT